MIIKKFKGPDPLDPFKLTLAQMRKPPYDLWTRFIEHKLIILGPEPEDCWCWDVDKRVHNTENWYPQVWATFKPNVKNPDKTNMNARRFIAQMFWEFPEEYVVTRNQSICTQNNCVRPSHILISKYRRAGREKMHSG